MASVNHEEVRERIDTWLYSSMSDGQRMSGSWVSLLAPHIKLESINDPAPPESPYHSLTFSFVVQPEHLNGIGTFHGGAVGTLFDVLTTLPLMTVGRPGFWQLLGVSRTLGVTYFRPSMPGDRVLVDCEIVQIGKRVCTLRGVMKSATKGVVLATCEHSKVNIDPEADGGKL